MNDCSISERPSASCVRYINDRNNAVVWAFVVIFLSLAGLLWKVYATSSEKVGKGELKEVRIVSESVLSRLSSTEGDIKVLQANYNNIIEKLDKLDNRLEQNESKKEPIYNKVMETLEKLNNKIDRGK